MSVTPAHIHESNLIEDIDDQTADACGIAAWHWLCLHDYLTEINILQLHAIVTASQPDLDRDHKGAWRDCQVYVGTHVPPPSVQVPDLMTVWCYALSLSVSQPDNPDAFSPREHHVAFERIHPFVDGNGRVGRLLLWFHEVQLGREPTFIRASERHKYYRWFRC